MNNLDKFELNRTLNIIKDGKIFRITVDKSYDPVNDLFGFIVSITNSNPIIISKKMIDEDISYLTEHIKNELISRIKDFTIIEKEDLK